MYDICLNYIRIIRIYIWSSLSLVKNNINVLLCTMLSGCMYDNRACDTYVILFHFTYGFIQNFKIFTMPLSQIIRSLYNIGSTLSILAVLQILGGALLSLHWHGSSSLVWICMHSWFLDNSALISLHDLPYEWCQCRVFSYFTSCRTFIL